jgi:hypothetical protein
MSSKHSNRIIKQQRKNKDDKNNEYNNREDGHFLESTPTEDYLSYYMDTSSKSNSSTANSNKISFHRESLKSISKALYLVSERNKVLDHYNLILDPKDHIFSSQKLEILDLSFNDFSFDINQNEINLEMDLLSDLKDINLAGSFKKIISPNTTALFNYFILKLQNLEILNLSLIELSILPPDISQLINLSSLILSQNELTLLPEEIGNLTNLSILDLSKNYDLQHLPKSLTRLNLCCCGTMDCKGLNIRHTGIFENFDNDDCCDKFLIYIRKFLEYEENHSFELKLTIIGNSKHYNNYINEILKTDTNSTKNENNDYFNVISKEYIPVCCNSEAEEHNRKLRFNIWNLSDKAADEVK